MNADFTRERLEFHKLLIEAHAQRDSSQEQERECLTVTVIIALCSSFSGSSILFFRAFVLLSKQNITGIGGERLKVD